MAGTRQDYLTGFTKAGNRGDIRDQGAPTTFVGHTFRDSAGQDWRWNTVKQKYYRSYGRAPGQDLQLGAMNWFQGGEKGVGGGQGNTDSQNRNQFFLNILQSEWDEAETEEDRASLRDLLVMFNAREEKNKIKVDTGAGNTTVIPGEGGFETPSQYRNRIKSDAEYKRQVEGSDNTDANVDATIGVDDLNKTEVLQEDIKPNPVSAGYQRPSPAERQKRRMEEILVRGRPGEKFKLDRERGRGTNIDDLFTKNREK